MTSPRCVFSNLMVIFIRNDETNVKNNSPGIHWILEIVMFLIAIIIAMFFPKNIKNYPVKKKLVIGIKASIILIVLFMAFFILAALIFF